MPKQDIILIIFKYCVSKIYPILILTKLKHIHDPINHIDK